MGPLFEKPFDPTPPSILNSVLNDDSGSVRCVGSNRNPESGKKSPPPGLLWLRQGVMWVILSMNEATRKERKND